MKTLILYYSRTGNTHRLAQKIAKRVSDPAIERIVPRRKRSYYHWLTLSFIPGYRVEIEPIEYEISDADMVFFGGPKWTLSCPPMNSVIDEFDFENTKVGLFLTYGGFDEERYAQALSSQLESAGAEVKKTLLVKRDEINSESLNDKVDSFASGFANLSGSQEV